MSETLPRRGTMTTMDKRKATFQRLQGDITGYKNLKYLYTPLPEYELGKEPKPVLLDLLKWNVKHGKLYYFSRAKTFLGFRIAIASWSECYVGVSKDKLYFYRAFDDTSSRPDFVYELENIHVQDLGEKEGRAATFMLNEIGGSQLLLSAATEADYANFVGVIRNGSTAFRENLQQFFLNKAITIQRVYRGFIQRQKYIKLVKVAVYIQKIYRGYRERCKFAKAIVKIIVLQTWFRGILAHKELQRLKLEGNVLKYQKKRTYIFNEIVSTEESYVTDLDTTITTFLKPLRALLDAKPERDDGPKSPDSKRSKSSDKIISPLKAKSSGIDIENMSNFELINGIFSNIEEIHDLHKKFLVQLQGIQNKWSELALVSQVFIELSVKLDIYLPYTVNYDDAMAMLEQLKKTNQTFVKFLGGVSDLKQVKKLDLFGFLIQPIQRLPRYVLLLKDLLKNTWSDHPDRHGLSEALSRLQKATTYLNEAKQKDEKMRRTKSILQRFSELSQVQDILNSDVLCLYEGPVQSLHTSSRGYVSSSMTSQEPQKSYLLLFNDQLILSQRDSTRRKIGKKSKTYTETVRFSNALPIPLKDISEDATPFQHSKYPNGFTISTEQSVYMFFTKTEEGQKKWIEEINSARKNFVLWNYSITSS